MSRGNAAANTTESARVHVRPIIFVEAQFDSGTLYLHNGVGTITWGAQSWLGAGAILEVGAIQDADERGPVGATFRLSALDASILSAAEGEDIFERLIIVYCGYLDATGNLVADPDERWRGFMDTTTIELGGEVDAVTLTAETELIRDTRTNGARFTDEDQQERYSGDTGFEFLDQIQDAVIQWGPNANAVQPGYLGPSYPSDRPRSDSRWDNT